MKRVRLIRFSMLALAALGPWSLRRLILRWLCDACIDGGAYVGKSFVDVDRLVMGKNAKIGSLNYFRGLSVLRLDRDAQIGNLNWVTAASSAALSEQLTAQNKSIPRGALEMGEGASITSRHYLDVHADVSIGAMAIIAGVRSTILTHSIDLERAVQSVAKITVGKYSFVGTNCVILPNSTVPDFCVIGAGSIVRGVLSSPYSLYAGVPAQRVKALPEDYGFFRRKSPTVFWDADLSS